MKVCVFGAGAIGGLVGGRLAHAAAERVGAARGVSVSLVTRGAHLAALRERGLTIERPGGSAPPLRVLVRATDDPAALGPQDVVMLTLKAHALPAAAPALQPLLGPETVLVSAMNGLPWWYFHGAGGPFEGRGLASVDPEGTLARSLPPRRAVGCVVWPAADVVAPGVVRHAFGERLELGEPDGSRSQRVLALAALLEAAGFEAPVYDDIRDRLWMKLAGNLCTSPISALTHATLAEITTDPGTRALSRDMMVEARRVAERLGVRWLEEPEPRLDRAGRVGAHRTSMLQDLLAGRPLEIDPVLGVVVELAGWVGVEVPLCRAVLSLVRQREAAARLSRQPGSRGRPG